jgi:hypothetical protein
MNPKGGLGSWLIRLLQNLPIIVSGIEKIHGDVKSGAEKKQIALEALGLSAYTAENVDPKDKPVIDAAIGLASDAIDGVKSVYNAANGKPAADPAPGPEIPQAPNDGFLQ